MTSAKEDFRILQFLARTSRLIWVIVIALLLILLAVVAVLQQARFHAREQVFRSVQDTNSKMVLSDEVRLRSHLATMDKVILVLRRDFADKPKMTRQELLDRLAELKLDGKLTPRVFFMDAAGDMLLMSVQSGSAQNSKLNFSDRAYFQDQKADTSDQLRVGAPFESRVVGAWSIPLTRRITHKDGSFGGIIGVAVDPALFTEPFEQTTPGLELSRSVIGLDGYTRVRLAAGKIEFGGDVRTAQLFDETKKSKAGSFTAKSAADGVQRMVGYRVVDPYGLVLVAGSSVASIEGLYAEEVRAYGIAAALFGGLMLALAGVLIHGIVRQNKLFASQQHFNQLIELVPQLVSRLDAKGNIIWVNSRTREYVGPSAQEQAKGFDWVLAVIHPDDKARVQEYVGSALARQQTQESCEYRKRRFDGAYLWFSSQITQVLDKEGGVASFLQTGTDIHDRKMAQERARVAQKLESIGQLTGGMAHDFNNLLAIILGNLDLVKPDVKVDAASRRLEVAIGAAQRGVGLVKSLLALASKQPLLPTRIDLWALVERIAPLLRHALGARVQFELRPPACPVQVTVDEAGLEAVLLNLIVNARDAMPNGGQLTLSLQVAAEMACISVTDTGTGMPEAVLKRATEPFFTTKERGHGTGLGLSMVAGFAKQSGGTLKIDSVPGRGTTMAIGLPVVGDAPVPTVAVAVQAPRLAMTGQRRILIVDDETEIADLVRDWAKAEGHIAVVANSADDALLLLGVKAFDVLLTDIMMPGELDGFDLTQRASLLHPTMKILLMSGYSKETATYRAEIRWPLLVKPFRKEAFLEAMEKALGVAEPVQMA